MTCAGPGTSGPSRDRCSAHTGSGSDSAVSAPTWALPPARRKAPGPAPDAPGDPGTGPRPASRSTAKATTSALRIARQPSKILKSQAKVMQPDRRQPGQGGELLEGARQPVRRHRVTVQAGEHVPAVAVARTV